MTMSAAIYLIAAFAQGPNDTGIYYSNADGMKGELLKTAMYNIISSHTTLNYGSLEDYYPDTDSREDGRLWDMYSNITSYMWSNTGSYKDEGDAWNKEHCVPQSWFGEALPMKSDIMHVVPVDGKINGMRSNYPFGEVGTVKSQSANGFSKLGTCMTQGYSGAVFEPNDEYKGDFARIYFYMATCYENKNMTSSNGNICFDGSTYPYFTDWFLQMLLRWAKNDPVSQKEVDRNAGVYKHQKNRNPFVDYPGLEEYVWGEWKNVAFSFDSYICPDGQLVPDLAFYVSPEQIDLGSVEAGCQAQAVFTITPNVMDGDIRISSTAGELDVTLIESTATDPVDVTLSYVPETLGKQSVVVTVTNGTLTREISIEMRAYSDEPLDYDFAKVTEEPDDGDWSGTYLIIYEAGKVLFDGSLKTLDAPENTRPVVIKDNTVASDDMDYSQYAFTVTRAGNDYLIQSMSELYIGRTSSSNGLDSNTSPVLTNSFLVTSDAVSVKSSGGGYLRFNNGDDQMRFRYYKSSSSQQPVALYKAVSGPVSVETVQPSETPSGSMMYNLAGQRVDAGYRGIVIIDGKKRLIR